MADKNIIKRTARIRRKKHIRKVVNGTAAKPRLVVYRSLKHIYAQMVDDLEGKTLIHCSSNSPKIADKLKKAKSKVDQGFIIGQMVGDEAMKKKIAEAVFDRNGYVYHGRVKAVAEGARKAGLKF